MTRGDGDPADAPTHDGSNGPADALTRDSSDEPVGDGAHDPADRSTAGLEDAVAAIERGAAVVYPTETVYGLGASATDADAVARVFEIKGRDHTKPISVGFPDLDTVAEFTRPTAAERAFMRRFLPGPVTVIVERGAALPDELTDGRPRVGVRLPDHDLARELARRAGPITATSANESGSPSVRTPAALSPAVRRQVGAILDDGEAPGTESTVVDVSSRTIHRRGALAETIEAWLADR
jgi:L-threonylcarbamoyladenylate synthase